MKAGEIIDRIKANIGVAWRDATYRDTFKAGGPDTEVTGIATTCFVTLDVIRKASAAGLNLIIPHEDTYWNDRDDTAAVAGDSVLAEKVALLKAKNIAVFRIHDHMHAQRPDFTYVGSARARCAWSGIRRRKSAASASVSATPRRQSTPTTSTS